MHVARLFRVALPIFLYGATVLAEPPHACDSCRRLRLDTARLEREETDTKRLLSANEALMKSLPLSKLPARIKLSSNIYIISTKLSLLGETLSGKKGEMIRLECDKCPKL